RPPAEAKGLDFAVEMPVEPLVLETDRRMLTQILFNLTNNAIKFTERGRVELVFDQHRENGHARVEFRVTDTGAGIRPEDHARLFGAFERLGAPGAPRPEGTGLGLHVSQKFAGLLGGRITCTSTYGQGSTFALVL